MRPDVARCLGGGCHQLLNSGPFLGSLLLIGPWTRPDLPVLLEFKEFCKRERNGSVYPVRQGEPLNELLLFTHPLRLLPKEKYFQNSRKVNHPCVSVDSETQESPFPPRRGHRAPAHLSSPIPPKQVTELFVSLLQLELLVRDHRIRSRQ